MNFRVDLDLFRGPIDLLHFLVRKSEVEIANVSIAKIAQQYQQYLDILKEIDINMVGDFLDVASQLVELKARAVLPRNEFESDEVEYKDPREDLVHRLLLYRDFKEASSLLDDQGRQWQERYTRQTNDLPPRKVDIAEQPIREVELWDLVNAFGRVLRDNQPPPSTNIYYDETPMHVHMDQIRKRIVQQGKVAFSEMFQPGMHKSSLVGIFLAILELTRHHSVKADQQQEHGEIWIVAGSEFDKNIDVSQIDDFSGPQDNTADPAAMVDRSL